jgi:hypothetical protein
MCVFLVLALVYAGSILFAPPGYLPGNARISDFTFNLLVWRVQLKALQSYELPFGVRWVRDYYGGLPVTILPFNAWQDLPNTIGTVLYGLLNDGIAVLRLMVFGSLVLSGVLAYFLAGKFVGDRAGRLVASVAYTFCPIHYTDIYYGHLSLLYGYALVPFALYSWENLLRKGTKFDSIVALLSLILLFFTEWQVLFFTILFLCLRIVSYLLHAKTPRGAILSRSVFVMSLFAAIAFLLVFPALQFYSSPTTAGAAYGRPDYLYFIRPIVLDFQKEIILQYAGLSILGLAGIALYSLHKVGQEEYDEGRNADFMWFAAILFVLYSAASSGSFNIDWLVTKLVPLAGSIRVISRSAIIAYLSFAMLAGMGTASLRNELTSFQGRLKRIRKIRIGVTLLIALLVFADLSAGFAPPATEFPKLNQGAYDFLKSQQGFFRVIAVPQYWGLATVAAESAGHEIIDYRPLYLKSSSGYTDIYQDVLGIRKSLPVRNGDFEDRLASAWNVSLSGTAQAAITNALSEFGNSSLHLLLGTDTASHLKIEQKLRGTLQFTNQTLLRVSVFPEYFANTTLQITIQLFDADTGNISAVSYFIGSNRSIPNSVPMAYSLESGKWNDLELNIWHSLSSPRLEPVKITLEIGKDSESQEPVSVYIDNFELVQSSPLLNKLVLYAVKYVLISKDSFGGNQTLGFGSAEAVRYLRLYLTLWKDYFRLVYRNESTEVYQNLIFKGFVFFVSSVISLSGGSLAFASPSGVSIEWKWMGSNLLLMNVSSKNAGDLVISQSLLEGWSVQLNGYSPFVRSYSNTTIITLPNGGQHTIRLEFVYNKLYGIAVALGVIAILIVATTFFLAAMPSKRRKKFYVTAILSMAYGFMLVPFGPSILSLTGFSQAQVRSTVPSLEIMLRDIGLATLLSVAVLAAYSTFSRISSRGAFRLQSVQGLLRSVRPHWERAWWPLTITASGLLLASYAYVTKFGPVFENGIFRGGALHLTIVNYLLSGIGTIVLSISIIERQRDLGKESCVSMVIVFVAIVAEGKLLSSEYILVASNPWENQVWLYLGSSLMIIAWAFLLRFREISQGRTGISCRSFVGSIAVLLLLCGTLASLEASRADVMIALGSTASFLATILALLLAVRRVSVSLGFVGSRSSEFENQIPRSRKRKFTQPFADRPTSTG